MLRSRYKHEHLISEFLLKLESKDSLLIHCFGKMIKVTCQNWFLAQTEC
jgi:hypothetical protein